MAERKAAADTEVLEAGLDRERMPAHVAIIMDGNGRWARERGLPRIAGHREGINTVRRIVRASGDLGLQVLTLYVFSSENWSRPRREVEALMGLLEYYLQKEVAELDKNGVRLRSMGRLAELPARVQKVLEDGRKALAGNDGLILNLALNYGGRAEIVDAVREIAAAAAAGRIAPEEVGEETIHRYLYSPDLPDPDLVIRTSGEQRMSNFLIWESSYSEFCVTPVLWPDFSRQHLVEAILEYQRRSRRYGGL